MAANMWKNSLKNVESDNNKILYETLLDFLFLQWNVTYFPNKPHNIVKYLLRKGNKNFLASDAHLRWTSHTLCTLLHATFWNIWGIINNSQVLPMYILHINISEQCYRY